MATATTEVKMKVTLELSREEAIYLKELTQNYLGPIAHEETPDQYDIRMQLFEALPSFKELSHGR